MKTKSYVLRMCGLRRSPRQSWEIRPTSPRSSSESDGECTRSRFGERSETEISPVLPLVTFHLRQRLHLVTFSVRQRGGGCRILRLARASWWYRAGQRSDRQQQMVARLHALSDAHPRVWLPADRRAVAAGRLVGGQAPSAAAAPGRGPAGASNTAKDRASWALDGAADQGHASQSRLNVGFYR